MVYLIGGGGEEQRQITREKVCFTLLKSGGGSGDRDSPEAAQKGKGMETEWTATQKQGDQGTGLGF